MKEFIEFLSMIKMPADEKRSKMNELIKYYNDKVKKEKNEEKKKEQ